VHVSAKLTFGIGAVVLVVGIGLIVVGGNSADDIRELSVEDDSAWSGDSGTYVHEIDDDVLLVFVSEEVRCDEFSLEIVRTDGASSGVKYVRDKCTEDGSMPEGHEDDPPGWYHLGAIKNLEVGVSYEVSTSDPFSAVSEELIVEIIEGVFGAIFGFGAGSSCICCGVLILIVGLVLALLMKDESPTTFQIDEQGRVIIEQQPLGSDEGPETSGDKEGESLSTTELWYKQNEK